MAFLSASGDVVPWDDLERAFYADPPPLIVSEHGLTLREYAAWVWQEEYLAARYEDDGQNEAQPSDAPSSPTRCS